MSEAIVGMTRYKQWCAFTHGHALSSDPDGELVRYTSCDTCAHWNADDASVANHGFCTNPNGWHRAKLMPSHEMCSKWETRDA